MTRLPDATCAVVIACCFLLLANEAVASQAIEFFAIGQTAYDEDRYAEAAEAFTKLLSADGVAETESDRVARDRAAYLLTLILFYQNEADANAIVGAQAGLDTGVAQVATAIRGNELMRASHALAFLRFREPELPLATQRLLTTMEGYTEAVEAEYAQVWEREVAHAVDISIDPLGRLWVLVAKPTTFLRLDQTGAVVERVSFVAPDALDAHSLAKAHFAVHPDGGFQLGAHHYAADGSALGSARVFPPDDLAVDANGTTIFLHNDGLRAVGPDGAVRWQHLGRGRRGGSFNHPRAVSLVGDAIVVTESRRLQRFSMKGQFESALASEAATRLPGGFKVSGMNDVSSANDRIFVGHLNARTVDVYTPQFEPVATFRLPAQRVAASTRGMIFGLKDERLSAAIEVPAGSRVPREAKAPSQPQNPPPISREKWQRERVPISFVGLEPPPANVRVHVSTGFVTSLAAGASDSPSILMGTYGGVLRWQPNVAGRAAWHHWSRMDGFPSDVIHDVHEGSDGTIWAVGGGAVLMRRPGEKAWMQLKRNGFGVNGAAVIGDRQRPGYVWIAAQRGLFHLDSTSTEAGFVPMKQRSPEEIVEMPDGRLFVRLGVNGVAAVDPVTGEMQVLVEMEDLRAVPGLRNPQRDRWIMTLSADPKANILWLGTDQRELFAFDLATQRVRSDWINGAIRPSCRRGEIRVQRVEETLHVLGFGCHALLEPGSDQLHLVFEHPGRGLDLLVTRDFVLLATTGGLYRIQGKETPTRVARPVSEPPDWAPISLAQVDGRIWVGFGNQGVGIYNGDTWSEIEVAGSVGRLRVEPDRVLAVASYGDGGTYQIDRDGKRHQRVAPGGPSWSYLRDILFDGQQWWAIGGPDPSRKHGIRRFRNGRDEHWGRAAGMPFGEARRIVEDLTAPGILWLASDVGLVRFEKTTQETEIVWPGDVKWLDQFEDGSLWAYGTGLLRFDPKTGLGSPFPFAGIPAPDPHDPTIVWIVADKELLRVDSVTGRILSRHEIGLGSLHARGLEILPSRNGWSAWIAGSVGLIELRLQRDSLVASPPPANDLQIR